MSFVSNNFLLFVDLISVTFIALALITVSFPTSYKVVFENIYVYSLQWLNHCGRAYENKVKYVDMTSAVFVLNEVASYADVRPT